MLTSTFRNAGFRGRALENMEQLWAKMRGKQTITREMRNSGRRDLLSDAAVHIGEDLLEKCGEADISRLIDRLYFTGLV